MASVMWTHGRRPKFDQNRDSIHFGSPRGDTISVGHVYHI